MPKDGRSVSMFGPSPPPISENGQLELLEESSPEAAPASESAAPPPRSYPRRKTSEHARPRQSRKSSPVSVRRLSAIFSEDHQPSARISPRKSAGKV
jgi:hypothetical protein